MRRMNQKACPTRYPTSEDFGVQAREIYQYEEVIGGRKVTVRRFEVAKTEQKTGNPVRCFMGGRTLAPGCFWTSCGR